MKRKQRRNIELLNEKESLQSAAGLFFSGADKAALSEEGQGDKAQLVKKLRDGTTVSEETYQRTKESLEQLNGWNESSKVLRAVRLLASQKELDQSAVRIFLMGESSAMVRELLGFLAEKQLIIVEGDFQEEFLAGVTRITMPDDVARTIKAGIERAVNPRGQESYMVSFPGLNDEGQAQQGAADRAQLGEDASESRLSRRSFLQWLGAVGAGTVLSAVPGIGSGVSLAEDSVINDPKSDWDIFMLHSFHYGNEDYLPAMKAAVERADIVVIESMPRVISTFQDVADGKKTPQQGIEAIEGRSPEGYQLAFLQEIRLQLKAIYQTGKRIVSDDSSLKDFWPDVQAAITEHQEKTTDAVVHYLEGDIMAAVASGRDAIEAYGEMVYLRDKNMSDFLLNLHERDPRQKIVVFQGVQHTSHYLDLRRKPAAKLKLSRSFLKQEKDMIFNTFEAAVRDVVFSKFGLKERGTFSGDEILQGVWTNAIIGSIQTVYGSGYLQKYRPGALKKIMSRIGGESQWKDLAAAINEELDKKHPKQTIAHIKAIFQWMLENDLVTKQELVDVWGDDIVRWNTGGLLLPGAVVSGQKEPVSPDRSQLGEKKVATSPVTGSQDKQISSEQIAKVLNDALDQKEKLINDEETRARLIAQMSQFGLEPGRKALVVGPGGQDLLPVVLAKLGIEVSTIEISERARQDQVELQEDFGLDGTIKNHVDYGSIEQGTFDYVFSLGVANSIISLDEFQKATEVLVLEPSYRAGFNALLTKRLQDFFEPIMPLLKSAQGRLFVSDFSEFFDVSPDMADIIQVYADEDDLSFTLNPDIDISNFSLFPGTYNESRKGYVFDVKTPNDLSAVQDQVGGIDLNEKFLDLRTAGRGADFDIPVNLQNLQTLPIEGLNPVILQIVPTSLPQFFGRLEEDSPRQLSALP